MCPRRKPVFAITATALWIIMFANYALCRSHRWSDRPAAYLPSGCHSVRLPVALTFCSTHR
jgi:hypothetical protein